MEFQFDPSKAAGNLRKHGVSFADAEGVFTDPLALHRIVLIRREKSGLWLSVPVARANCWLWSTLCVAKSFGLFPHAVPLLARNVPMRAEYDFSKAKRTALIPSKGKTRITIYIDDAVLDEFRARSEKAGSGYQTMMNDALKAYLADTDSQPLTEAILRRIIREELPRTARPIKRAGRHSKTRATER